MIGGHVSKTSLVLRKLGNREGELVELVHFSYKGAIASYWGLKIIPDYHFISRKK